MVCYQISGLVDLLDDNKSIDEVNCHESSNIPGLCPPLPHHGLGIVRGNRGRGSSTRI